MLRQMHRRGGYLCLGAALFLAGFVVGERYKPQTAQAQPGRFGEDLDTRRNRDGQFEGVQQPWVSGFGFAIPAEGGAVVRAEEGRAYFVASDGEVSELSIGDGPRTPTPLRPR